MKSELGFEDELIDHLTKIGNDKQWQYEPNIKTTDQLWDNFKKILEQHNQDKLESPLSNNEFAQVRRQIEDLHTPYMAGRFLYGFNGQSGVSVDLDNGKQAILTVFKQDQIGAGDNIYQVVNQIERPAKISGRRDRRFDVTMLINGLPIIQIEEKRADHPVKEAFNQMQQYIDEGQYTDIFSTLQILVGMTPNETRYMANTPYDDFNTDFAFQWEKESNNEPVSNWRDFSNRVLSIPMAHEMATNYMILDGSRGHQSIKVMRPYQVYATKRVINKLKTATFEKADQKLGYIWHTTGSGKTISSFKTAWLASRLPNVDKVVFIVDRRALTQQTAESYSAYDPDSDDNNKNGVVDNTANVRDLAKKLKSNGNGIVVTSIQKLDKLVQRKAKLPDKNVLFIVDEAHRSTSGDMLQRAKDAFPHSEWVGYTGTPKFADENGKSDGPTTQEIFGDLLHAYTIRQAIADHNVLGFKVDFNTTLPGSTLRTQYLPEFYRQKYPKWSQEKIDNKINNLTQADMDDQVSSSVYDYNEDHINKVADDIISKWKNRSVNYKYSAILTTHVGGMASSSKMAKMYYDAITKKTTNSDHPLKVAVTFSNDNSNHDNMNETNKNLNEAIEQYNQTFGTNFGAKTIKEYREDVMSRLNQSNPDKNYLDLVIVVDQLLTGFDAPTLNTLYVDRTLRGANLIQAYSRTNRIQDSNYKRFGRIINYRWPKLSEDLMNDALAVYANKDSANYQTKLPIGQDADDDVIQPDFHDKISETAEVVDKLDTLTNGFQYISPSQDEDKETLKLLRTYNNNVVALKQYDEYDYDHPNDLLDKLGISEDQEVALTTKIQRELKNTFKKDDPDFDVDFKMEHINEIDVDYDYLRELLAQLANQVNDENEDGAVETYNKLNELADQVEEKYAQKIKRTAEAIKNDEIDKSKLGSYPLNGDDMKDLMDNQEDLSRRSEILKFRQKYGFVDADGTKDLFNKILDRHIYGNDDLDNNGELKKIINLAQNYYQQDAIDPEVKKLSKIKYRINLRKAVEKFADKLTQEY